MTAEFLTKGIIIGEQSEYEKSLIKRSASAHWETVSMWFSVLILAVFPLLNGTDSYYNITESKYFYFNIFTIGYLILIGFIELSYFMDKPMAYKRYIGGKQKLNISQILIAAYFLSACISSLLSGYGIETLVGISRYEGLITIFLYSSIFFFLSFWGEYHDMYIWSASIAATVFGVISILQLCGIDFISPDGLSYADHEFIGTMGNVDMVAAYFSIVIPLMACAYIIMENKIRYICLAGIALCMHIQFFADVDSCKIGLIAFAVVTMPFLANCRKRFARLLMVFSMFALAYGLNKFITLTGTSASFSLNKTALLAFAVSSALAFVSVFLERMSFEFPFSARKMEIIIAVFIVICIIAALVYVYNYTGSVRIITEACQIMHGYLADTAGTNRGFIWKNTWTEVMKKPVFGGGPGLFKEIFTKNSEIYDGTREGKIVDFAHNDFLQIAACQGLVGLGLYLAFLAAIFIRAIKTAEKNPLVIIFMGACISYLAHSFFSFSIAIVTPLFWVLAGIMDKCVRQSYPQDLVVPKNLVEPPKENRKRRK